MQSIVQSTKRQLLLDKAAVRNSNNCTICDSTRDQYLMKTAGLFLEVSPFLLSLDMLDIQPFPNLIWHERALQVEDFEVSRQTVQESYFVSSLRPAEQYDRATFERKWKTFFYARKHNLISCWVSHRRGFSVERQQGLTVIFMSCEGYQNTIIHFSHQRCAMHV